MKVAFMLVASISILGGCDARKENSVSAPSPLEWRSAPDGSHFYQATDNSWAVRCWKITSGFDCIQVTAYKSNSKQHYTYNILRNDLKSLPTNLFNINPNGYYLCSFFGDSMYESLGKGNSTLKTNTVSNSYIGQYDASWSPNYVKDWANKNGLFMYSKYFNCEMIGKVLDRGSLASLGTTDIDIHVLD